MNGASRILKSGVPDHAEAFLSFVRLVGVSGKLPGKGRRRVKPSRVRLSLSSRRIEQYFNAKLTPAGCESYLWSHLKVVEGQRRLLRQESESPGLSGKTGRQRYSATASSNPGLLSRYSLTGFPAPRLGHNSRAVHAAYVKGRSSFALPLKPMKPNEFRWWRICH